MAGTVLLLAILQGLTEFLPVSSSAHLLFLQKLLAFNQQVLTYDIFLHAGTLFAVLFFFRRDIILLFDLRQRQSQREVLQIVVASLPAALTGIGLRSFLEPLFSSSQVAAAGLLLTALILIFSSRRKSFKVKADWLVVLFVGIAQAAAIVPGISRAGATISCALLLGWDFQRAFRFSFLLSLPAVGGAVLIELKKLTLPSGEFYLLLIAVGGAFLFGLIALKLLVGLNKEKGWLYFGIYCLLLAVIVNFLLFIGFFPA